MYIMCNLPVSKLWANFCVSQTILAFNIQIMLSAVILNLFKHLVGRHPFLWILKTPICVNLHNLTDKEMYCPLLEVQNKIKPRINPGKIHLWWLLWSDKPLVSGCILLNISDNSNLSGEIWVFGFNNLECVDFLCSMRTFIKYFYSSYFGCHWEVLLKH